MADGVTICTYDVLFDDMMDISTRGDIVQSMLTYSIVCLSTSVTRQ